MGEEEVADARVEGEAVRAVPRGVDQHRVRAVQRIAGRDLLPAGEVQRLGERLAAARGPAVHREDRADRHVHVDVRRAVQRVHEHDVLALVGVADNAFGPFHFLGDHLGDELAVGKGFEKRLVRDFVQLLDDLALHVEATGRAERVGQPGHAQPPRNTLGGQRNLGQQDGKLAGRAGMALLLHENVAGQGDALGRHTVLLSEPSRRASPAGAARRYVTKRSKGVGSLSHAGGRRQNRRERGRARLKFGD